VDRLLTALLFDILQYVQDCCTRKQPTNVIDTENQRSIGAFTKAES